jgi:exodeoxyribonuclease-3
MEWDDAFREYVKALAEHKGVIICGDLNVAHQAIDLKNPKTNERNAGYTIEEREKFTRLLEAGFVDTFRYLYPDATEAYSWWSYRFQSRSRNTGWRIDYWLVSERLKERVVDSTIATEVMGSDHAPVILTLR